VETHEIHEKLVEIKCTLFFLFSSPNFSNLRKGVKVKRNIFLGKGKSKKSFNNMKGLSCLYISWLKETMMMIIMVREPLTSQHQKGREKSESRGKKESRVNSGENGVRGVRS
jgi:hypothetical protein